MWSIRRPGVAMRMSIWLEPPSMLLRESESAASNDDESFDYSLIDVLSNKRDLLVGERVLSSSGANL